MAPMLISIFLVSGCFALAGVFVYADPPRPLLVLCVAGFFTNCLIDLLRLAAGKKDAG